MKLEFEKHFAEVNENGHVFVYEKDTGNSIMHINAERDMTEQQIRQAIEECLEVVKNLYNKN